jgi:hypothetical protein
MSFRGFVRYTVQPYFRDRGERFWLWVAKKLPHKLRYWVVISVWAEVTTGQYSDTLATDLTMAEALKRMR